MKILIADDSPLVRALLVDQLQMEGVQIFEANDGTEALSIARAELPNVILADHDMPNLDGEGVCKAVLADAGLSRIPVLVLTGSKDPAIHDACIRAGAAAVLGKDDDPAALLAAIMRVAPPQ